MSGDNGGVLGRVIALALILAVAFGVRFIAYGDCCSVPVREAESTSAVLAVEIPLHPDASENMPSPSPDKYSRP